MIKLESIPEGRLSLDKMVRLPEGWMFKKFKKESFPEGWMIGKTSRMVTSMSGVL